MKNINNENEDKTVYKNFYTFYINSWTLHWWIREKILADEIWITSDMSKEQIEERLQEYYQNWLDNQNWWWE